MSGFVDQTRGTGTGSGLAELPGLTESPERSAVRRKDARTRREAARAMILTELMSERRDLAGVYEPADFAAEAIRWGV
jgi:hypothetical protein